MLRLGHLFERRADHDHQTEPGLADRPREQTRLLVARCGSPLDRDPVGARIGELALGQDAPRQEGPRSGVHDHAVRVDDLCERLLVGQRGLDGLVAAGGEIAFEVREPGGQTVVERLPQRVAVLEVDEHADEQAQHGGDEREYERQPAAQGSWTQPHPSTRSLYPTPRTVSRVVRSKGRSIFSRR